MNNETIFLILLTIIMPLLLALISRKNLINKNEKLKKIMEIREKNETQFIEKSKNIKYR